MTFLHLGCNGSFPQLQAIGQALGDSSLANGESDGSGEANAASHGCSWLLEQHLTHLHPLAQPRMGAAECVLASGLSPRLRNADIAELDCWFPSFLNSHGILLKSWT